MDENKETICCFTGHREIPETGRKALETELKKIIALLVRQGVTHFRVGGALGFDTMAALALLEQRKETPDVTVELCIPCPGQESRWSAEDAALYRRILEQMDLVTLVSDHYFRGCMHKRNRYMVDGSTYCIAYCTSDQGGTASTVKYALQQGVKLINLAILLEKK